MKIDKCLLCSFKFLCVFMACWMAGYWILKYLKNEDITLVEYEAFNDSDNVNLPALSICFMNKDGKMGLHQGYNNVTDSQDTLNFVDYLDNITLYLRKSYSGPEVASCSNPNNCWLASLKNNFNGPINNSFTKCFEMKIEKKYSKHVYGITLYFKDSFQDVLRRTAITFIRFHYPGQLFLDFRADHFLWKNSNGTGDYVAFKIDSIEIIRRRSKPNKRCFGDARYYDELLLKHLIKKTGCRPPYYNFQDEDPVCNTNDELAVFDTMNFAYGNFSLPCEEMSQVSFKLLDYGSDDRFGLYCLQIAYPEKMKIITQQQAIDLHALIGNIGGYIGLILGVF